MFQFTDQLQPAFPKVFLQTLEAYMINIIYMYGHYPYDWNDLRQGYRIQLIPGLRTHLLIAFYKGTGHGIGVAMVYSNTTHGTSIAHTDVFRLEW